MLQNQIKGSYILTKTLATIFKSLQLIPCKTPYGKTIYLDLRITSSHPVLTGNVWKQCEMKWIERLVRAGDVVLDIGAHVGAHTILLSHLVGPKGKVFAFEPNPRVLPMLEYTISKLNNATLYPFALSNTSNQSLLFVPEDDSMSSLADWTGGKHGKVSLFPCETHSLDELVGQGKIPNPDFIKCDVEGAELLVFKGGNISLNNENAPILLFEFNTNAIRGFGFTPQELIKFLYSLEKAGYEIWIIDDEIKAIMDVQLPMYCDMLAIPEAKKNRLKTKC